MKAPKFLTGILMAAFVATAVSAVAQPVPDSTTHTLRAKKFNRWRQQSNTIVLDVRTPEEFKEGHIPGARNIDVKQDSSFRQQVLQLDPSKRYLLYCRTGKRSTKAMVILTQAGFPKLYQLKGGIESWKGKLDKESRE